MALFGGGRVVRSSWGNRPDLLFFLPRAPVRYKLVGPEAASAPGTVELSADLGGLLVKAFSILQHQYKKVELDNLPKMTAKAGEAYAGSFDSSSLVCQTSRLPKRCRPKRCQIFGRIGDT